MLSGGPPLAEYVSLFVVFLLHFNYTSLWLLVLMSLWPQMYNDDESLCIYISFVSSLRAHAEMHLRGKQNGTFLCRPSGKAVPAIGGIHTHTIDIV